MYKAIKHKFGSRSKAAIVAMLCAVYLLCFSTVGYAAPKKLVHVEGEVQMEIVKADIVQTVDVEDAAVEINTAADSVRFDVSGLRHPGAGAVAHFTAKNTGTLRASLVDVRVDADESDFLKAEISDNVKSEYAPGETCEFDVAVYWDPDFDDFSSNVIEEEIGFEIVLVYENDDYYEVASGNDADDDNGGSGGSKGGNSSKNNGSTDVKTGDSAAYGVFTAIAAVAAVTMIVCLIFILLGKKKEKEDEQYDV